MNKCRAESQRINRALVEACHEVLKDQRNSRKEMTHNIFAIPWVNVLVRAQGWSARSSEEGRLEQHAGFKF